MKKTILLSFVILSYLNFAQNTKKTTISGGFIFGKTLSNFTFKDSESTKDKELDAILGSMYGVNLLINLKEKHSIRPEVLFYQAGAKKTIDDINLNWNLNYLGLGLGYNYSLIKFYNSSFKIGCMLRADYLMKAEQTINDSRINLIEEKSFKKLDINANMNASLHFKLSEFSNLFVEYRYAFGINQIERDENASSQKTFNKAHQGVLGINFKL